MGVAVLVLGASGSGKSTSLRNMSPEHVEVLNVAGKPLPFRGQLPSKNFVSYDDIHKAFRQDGYPIYVVDDSQYLMAFEGFDKANEKGYDKFTHMAVHFKEMITDWIRELPEHTIVYFLHHTEIGDDQRIKPKTLGKMLDSQLVVEGLFSIVLLTWSEAGNHFFVTNSDGSSCAKTPMGMFADETIDNDLALVDRTIREYYGWPELGGVAPKQHQDEKPAKKPAAKKADPVKKVKEAQPEADAALKQPAAPMPQIPTHVPPEELKDLPPHLAQLMDQDNIWPIELQAFASDPERGWYTADTPISNWDPDLLSYLPEIWTDVIAFVKKNRENEPF